MCVKIPSYLIAYLFALRPHNWQKMKNRLKIDIWPHKYHNFCPVIHRLFDFQRQKIIAVGNLLVCYNRRNMEFDI